MNKPINVKHSRGSYPIHFSERLNDMVAPALDALKSADDFVLVINEQVGKIYTKELEEFAASIGCKNPPLLIKDGEQYKNLATIDDLCTKLSNQGLSRKSCLLAIGGGVTTDLVGYAASSYMRGIKYVQVPTTLLAQVDASIGGKTGVNLTSGKNLVGAFHPPAAVLIVNEFLTQLPADEFSCGMAELIKHAVLADSRFFAMLEGLAGDGGNAGGDASLNALSETLRSSPEMTDTIRHACQIKVDLVQQDEHEALGSGGKRALLNLGHTFAHGLEAMGQYKSLKHGQAVAIGMIIASRISKQLGHINDEDCTRIESLLSKAGLPTSPNSYLETGDSSGGDSDAALVDQVIEFMMRDKKKHDSLVPLVLLKEIGSAYVSEPYTREQLKDMLIQAIASRQ